MNKPAKQLVNVTSLKSIKSEGNLRKNGRKASVGGVQTNAYQKRTHIYQSQKNLPHNPSEKTIFKSPQHSKQSFASPVKTNIIKQFNQQFLLYRNNNLNDDIEMIQKYKKQLERSFIQLKKLEEESKQSIKIINKLNLRIQQLEFQNKELKKLGDYKDSLIESLEEKIRVLMDQNMVFHKSKSSHTLDIIVSTEKQINNMKGKLIDLSKLDTRIGGKIPKPHKEVMSKDLTNSTVSINIKQKQDIKNLQQRLRSTETSLGFYKQREQELQSHIRQLQEQIQKYQSNNKTNFDTHKDTLMMLYTQAASLQAMIK